MRDSPIRSFRPFAVFLAILVNGFIAPASFADRAEQDHRLDCGTLALHTLLTLEGHRIPLDALRARLPRLDPRGYSLAELRDTARSFGLNVRAARIPRSDHAPDRPVLALLRRDDHGHFVVLRPVGHSGKLVQVIDSAGDPLVVDAVDLYASSPWTGMALIPARPNWPLRIALGLLVLSGSSLALLLVASRSRTRRAGTTDPTVPPGRGQSD